MGKELPKMYENKINKKLNNTQLVYSTLDKNTVKEESPKEQKKDHKLDHFTIEQKIYNIFHSPNYIYKADVTIVTEEYTKKERIIGKNNNNLITFNGEYIPISSIKDIYQ